MKKKSHFQLASCISAEDGLIPHSLMFRIGSIMPDLFLFSYIKGHGYDKTSSKTATILDKLISSQRLGRLACFRLGYRVHYLADYFTYPHDPSYREGLIQHNKYEADMRMPLSTALEQRGGVRKTDTRGVGIADMLHALHEKYRLDDHCIDSDISYILKITDMIYSALLSVSVKRASV